MSSAFLTDRYELTMLAAALRENLKRRKAQSRESQPNSEPTQPAKE